MIEKPMSISLADAYEMISAAEQNGVVLGVIFQNRYNPGSKLVKAMLESGQLGRIISSKLSVTWKRTDEYYSRSDWKGTWDKEGGGVIIDQAIHTLDLARWLVDSEIEFVDATISNRTHTMRC
ncbi:MAG: Gfo/Idh/MocA family oxidoreductase [Limnochordia bacterium]